MDYLNRFIVISFAVGKTISISIRNHQNTISGHLYYNDYQAMNDNEDTFNIIVFCMVCAFMAVSCYFCYQCRRNRYNQNNTIISPALQQPNYNFANNQYNSPPLPVYQNNYSNNYPNNYQFNNAQSVLPFHQDNANYASNGENPYLVRTPKNLSSDKNNQVFEINGKQNLKQKCVICNNSLDKNGQTSRMMVNCSYSHIFHTSCLSSYRANIVRASGKFANASQCPKCKQNYSNIVRLYCQKCRKNYMEINIVQNSDESGFIMMDVINAKNGQRCNSCT